MSKQARRVQLQFRPEVTKEEVHSAIDSVLGRYGCPTCGLRGIDVQLYGGDPEVGEMAKLKGVTGVVSSGAA
jgi:hypothetical protein